MKLLLNISLPAIAGLVLLITAPTPALHGQSAAGLLDLLQKKGLVSEQEVRELRAEAAKDFGPQFKAKTGLPDWVTRLKFNGDFVGYYQVQQPNAGFVGAGAGYGGGTNVRGHVAKASYSITDSLIFGLTYYHASLIDEIPAGSRSSVGHLMVDLIWKF